MVEIILDMRDFISNFVVTTCHMNYLSKMNRLVEDNF